MANKKTSESVINNTLKDEPTLSSQSTGKKIGFFSAMLIAMGSSIGAGIFFKAQAVLKYSQGSFIFAILAWLIAAFAVIAMALALVEIASARNDNLSMIGWCKVFNSRTIYKASKNFMFYIYLPLTYFFMPLYVIMSFQDAMSAFTNGNWITFGTSADWFIWLLIAFIISLFFIFVSGISSRAGDIMNKVIMSIKFLPLAATIILGFVIAAMPENGFGGVHVSAGPIDAIKGETEGITTSFNPWEFQYMSPGIGLFMAMGGIFFAYDGFYVTAGLQTEMKEPKKTPLAIVLGLGIVTIIYLLIAISTSIIGNGGIGGFSDWLADHNASWVYGVLNLTIAIGVLGIINGFAMWAPRFTEDLIKEKELPFSNKYIDKINSNKYPMIGIYYTLIATIPLFIIFGLIGALAYVDDYSEVVDGQTIHWYGQKEIGSLYTFSDLLGTWTAVFAFMFIMLPIFGGIKNRKQNFVKTEKSKYFLPFAWVSVIIIGIVLLLLFVDAIVNVFMLINISSGVLGESPDNSAIIGVVMKFVTLIIFVAIMIVPTIIEDYLNKKKYGTIYPHVNNNNVIENSK